MDLISLLGFTIRLLDKIQEQFLPGEIRLSVSQADDVGSIAGQCESQELGLRIEEKYYSVEKISS